MGARRGVGGCREDVVVHIKLRSFGGRGEEALGIFKSQLYLPYILYLQLAAGLWLG